MKFEDIEFPNKYSEDFRLRVYYDLYNLEYALVMYLNLDKNCVVPVRIHSACLTGDIFHSLKCDCGDQLDESLKYIRDNKMSMVIYLSQEGRGIGIVNKIKAYKLQQKGLNTFEANTYLNLPVDNREYSMCPLILNDFGIRKIELITNNPDKLKTVYRSPLISYVKQKRLDITPNKYSVKYIKDKDLFFSNL